ncbi:reverse transcriptase domain-containing protein, partial [Tanacetum coccineum]
MSSDSASSEVTYTSISSHGDPLAWAVDFFRLQEPDSPEAAPASPDYVPGPEELEQAPFSPDYVPVEDQPYAVADSPIALSPGYVADSDPEEDSEDGLVDYPADGGDGYDDDSSNNDEEEEEEHLAPVDSVIAPVVDHVPSSEETKPFETDESAATPPSSPAYRTTSRISILPEAPMPFPSEEEVERLLALPPPPPPSPLISLSPPSAKERLARLRASSPSTHHPLHPSPPLPPPPSSLHLPPHVPTSLPLPLSPLPSLPASLFIPLPIDHREDIPEAELPPRKRLCLTTLTLRHQRAEEVGYGIRDVWVDPTEAVEEVAPTTLEGVNDIVTELAAVQEQDTQDVYAEALVSREAWAHSVGLSSTVHYKLQAYRTHTQMQDFRIASQESLMTTLITHVSSLQGQLSAALGQIQALQARSQTHADNCEGAASMAVGLNNMPPRRSSAAARAAAATRAVVAAATPMTAAAVEQLIKARVSAALANHETLRNSTNGQGDGSHNSDTGIRGTVCTPRECTYKDFLNYKPLSFKGTEGVVVLSQWFEKIESMFHISNCVVENQVKFATCTFLGNALTWWNSHMNTVTQVVAYAMEWKTLKKMMTFKYCPRGEIKKLENKLWNLKVKG